MFTIIINEKNEKKGNLPNDTLQHEWECLINFLLENLLVRINIKCRIIGINPVSANHTRKNLWLVLFRIVEYDVTAYMTDN